MAESTLSLTFDQLAAEVGINLGWGPGAYNGGRAWSAQQAERVKATVASGVRQVYTPPPLNPNEPSYDWSFLKPIGSVTLPAGVADVNLPDDFGQPEGRAYVTAASNSLYAPVDFTADGRILGLRSATPDRTGQPTLLAVSPIKGTAPGRGQRFKLMAYPTPDQDYTVRFAYYVLPDLLDGHHAYVWGGMALSELFLESCLAIAEQRLDDRAGIHTQKFMQALAAAVSADRRRKPQNMGYNGDASDARHTRPDRAALYVDRWGGTTYNGTQY